METSGRTNFHLPADCSISQAVTHLSRLFASLPTDFTAEARMLVCAAANVDRLAFLRDPDRKLDAESARRLDAMATRRLAREPVSRIIGRRGFWSLDLEVTSGVLDPRGDTETLVEAALRLLNKRRNESLRIMDLGTGSGAILCALLSEFPNAIGVGLDASPDACAAARRNLERCGLADRARIIHGSWADSVSGRFDLIASNPPYIESDVIPTLDPEVTLHDPTLALDGGPDGLEAYRSIADGLHNWMQSSAMAVLEIGSEQAGPVTNVMQRKGLRPEGLWRDLGGNDRVLAFSVPEQKPYQNS